MLLKGALGGIFMIKITGLLYKEDTRTLEETIHQGTSQKCLDSFKEFHWKDIPYDEVIFYDLDEQIYKKRKVYFHISRVPLNIIRPKSLKKYRTIPAAFFAMDAQTCIDFFKYKSQSFGWPAFLHRCLNNRAMNLFNPASDIDLHYLDFDQQKLLHPAKLRMISKNIRYWSVLEDDTIMKTIYARTTCDGIALDFYQHDITSWDDRTEGFCLFDRGINAINVIDVARIDNIQTSPVDLRKLTFWDAKSPELLS
jgi:hypothetical protein